MYRCPVPGVVNGFRAAFRGLCLLAVAQAVALAAQEPGVRLPPPTGTFPVGVLDFEFVDDEYPSRRESDSTGRRLMARVWYPAAAASGQPRRYMEGRELDILGRPLLEALSPVIQDPKLFDDLAAATTHSFEGAPVAAGGPFPALVFSHGGLSYVSQNTPLMEDLASHGYIVFSVGHPGGSSGVLFPDGTAVTYDQDWRDAVMGAAAVPDPDGRYSPDVGKRYGAVTRSVDDGGLGPWATRWRDDMIALVDFLYSDHAARSVLASILNRTVLEDLGYFGMSYGAAAAVSAAQVDHRAKAAINFDGTHWLSDVLGEDVRTPLLVLTSEDPVTYSNEFFFEPLTTMGTREDIVRIKLQPEATHMELSDIMFLPAAARQALPGGGRVDGARLSDTINTFIRAFFDHHLKGAANGYPESVLTEFPETTRFDLPHVRAWATARQP